MKLAHSTWPEVEDYLALSDGIILPVGSTEQHGPMGLVGTDAICASVIAEAAGEISGAMVAPTVCYTPAPFNMCFPGTVSISEETFVAMLSDIIAALSAQGFKTIYVLNAHGANLAPLRSIGRSLNSVRMPIRSWWQFDPVMRLRKELYGDWEGLHATPSEVAITQARVRRVAPGPAVEPPRRLSPEEIAERAGDNHGSPERHRREFPDGRVGSHSAMATPEEGARLLAVAAEEVAKDYDLCLRAPRSTRP